MKYAFLKNSRLKTLLIAAVLFFGSLQVPLMASAAHEGAMAMDIGAHQMSGPSDCGGGGCDAALPCIEHCLRASATLTPQVVVAPQTVKAVSLSETTVVVPFVESLRFSLRDDAYWIRGALSQRLLTTRKRE